jgi:uncharacterized damage-inducible protein DinB
MNFPFEVMRQTRKNTLSFLENLDEDKINKIPDGFGNNIAWNLGHILITQQLLFYTNSGNMVSVPQEWIEKYRKGSKPSARISIGEFEQIKALFVSSIDNAEKDYKDGIFSKYKAYKTSYGIQIENIEDLIRFLYAHDAFHWGVIASLMKIV